MATYQLPFSGDQIKNEIQQLVNNEFDNTMKALSPNASSDTNDVATTQWVKAETEAELDNYYTKAEIEAKIVEYDGEVISENEIRNLPQLNALWHRGIMGVESCILDYGEKLAPMIVSGDNQHIRILNGVGMMQGRFFRVKDYDTIAIPNGAQNYNRIDLVCAKITQNENGTQTFSWEVVQGTQTEGTPTPPTVAEGSLDDGDEYALMPIASVELEGVNIVAVETVAYTSKTMHDLEEKPAEIIDVSEYVATRTSGVLDSAALVLKGKVATLAAVFHRSVATPVGSNCLDWTLTKYLPLQLSNGAGYYGSTGVIAQFAPNGILTGRVIGAQLPVNATVYLSITYIIDDNSLPQ